MNGLMLTIPSVAERLNGQFNRQLNEQLRIATCPATQQPKPAKY